MSNDIPAPGSETPDSRAARDRNNERRAFERLSLALTNGNAGTWEEVFHAAEEAQQRLQDAQQRLITLTDVSHRRLEMLRGLADAARGDEPREDALSEAECLTLVTDRLQQLTEREQQLVGALHEHKAEIRALRERERMAFDAAREDYWDEPEQVWRPRYHNFAYYQRQQQKDRRLSPSPTPEEPRS